ncbi:MAG: response regulator transcription factor [Chloroflexota bacterium]
MNVLMAHSCPLLRAGLRSTLTYVRDVVLIGEVDTTDCLPGLCWRLCPDMVLLEPKWLDSTAIRTYLNNHLPRLRILLFGDSDAIALSRYVTLAYVAGYVPFDVEPDTLVQALRTIAHGGTWFTEDTIAQLRAVNTEERVEHALSKREQEVLQLLVQCDSNQEIAAILGISDKTVAKYLGSLYSKLGVDSRLAAAMYAVQHGLVELPKPSNGSNTTPFKRRKTSQ